VKTAWAALIAVVLLFSSGCTRPDWIEATLVTADVTGVWQGEVSTPTIAPGVRPITLDLKQEGPKVTGLLQIGGGGVTVTQRYSGSLTGRVGGDVFHFTVVSGHGESLTGHLMVNSDEMQGVFAGGEVRDARIAVRRVDLPSRLQRESP
jgi:hypothetical protein